MQPRIRSANKYQPPWQLNKFPEDFALAVGSEIIAHVAVDRTGAIEGQTWERMFATAIGAEWKPSNVGLDDIVLKDCAWGAKTVKASAPFAATSIRLISGRNDPRYSYGYRPKKVDALGKMVLGIWNKRVSDVRKNYRHVRSVVLIKPGSAAEDWLDFVAFEFDTIPYEPKEFRWEWNKQKNLEGWNLAKDEHWFTWQPHGAQFTIVHEVPNDRLRFQVKKPAALEAAKILKVLAFEKGWVRIVST